MTKIKKLSILKKVIIILGIIILPVIYSYFYLNGFWDPYNKLNKIPIAIVNLDKCTNNCQSTELVNEIIKDGTFDFELTNEKDADKGLINKKYYSVIKIPKDFTQKLNNVNNKNRKHIEILYSPNLKTSYLVAQFTNSAVKQIANKLNLEIATTAVENLTDSIQTTFDQTKQISSGLAQISAGAYEVNYGAYQLSSGANNLNIKYAQFNSGVKSANKGIKTINSNMPQLVNGATEINQGLTLLQKEVNSSASQFDATVLTNLTTAKNSTSTAITNLTNTNNTLKNGYTVLMPTVFQSLASNHLLTSSDLSYVNINNACSSAVMPYTNQIMTSANLSTFTSSESCLEYFSKIKTEYENNYTSNTKMIQLLTGDKTAVENLITVAQNMSQLKTGVDELQTGSTKLVTGVNTLNKGINQLTAGLEELETYSSQISNGINTLSTGTNNLATGSNTLNTGINTAKTEVDNKIADNEDNVKNLDGLSNYTKSSAKINQKNYGKVDDYGTFFSPYFMSLSLWVGGILILMGLYYDPEKRFKILGKETESREKRLIFYNIIGIIQAIILAFVLKTCLGFQVTNIWLFYGSCILISEAFLAIIMFLFFAFKDIGKFLALVFLVLQLASCGGTFPVVTEPAMYQYVYPYMPMTYSVDLLRESFVNINSKFLGKDVIILISLLIVFTILIILTSLIKNRNEIKNKIQKRRNKKIKK